MGRVIALRASPIVPGSAAGTILASDKPLSFWGGYDAATGEIIDRRHPLAGLNARGCILVLPGGRGSCSGSGVLFEAIRNGSAPAAIITSSIDPIISLGVILADELYANSPVLAVVSEAERMLLNTGLWLAIENDGRMSLATSPATLEKRRI